MNPTIVKLAAALGCQEADLEVSLARTDLSLVWDPERVMPEGEILGVQETNIIKDGQPTNQWYTLKRLEKGKFTSRGSGEVHKWKA